MEVLLEPMAEDNECLGCQVEEARLDRWTSVGYVKVQGQSVRHVLSPLCTCALVRVSRQNMTLCGTCREIAVSSDSKNVARNTNSLRPL